MNVKTFYYLNEYRMFSLSSQVFEGLTDYYFHYKESSEFDENQQKGPVGSGRVIADIAATKEGVSQRRFLHDYAYSLLENHLHGKGRILTISRESEIPKLDEIEKYDYVKFRGLATIYDFEMLREMVKNFNEIGQAMAYVSAGQDFENQFQEVKKQVNSAKDRNEKVRLQEQLKKFDPKNLPKTLGLHMNDRFKDSLTRILEFGFKDNLEIAVSVPDRDAAEMVCFTMLDDEYLRYNRKNLVHRLSFFPEKEITVFGQVTGCKEQQPMDWQPLQEKSTKESNGNEEIKKATLEEENLQNVTIRDAVEGIVRQMFNVDLTVSPRRRNEITIDPIAVYRETSEK